MRWFSAGLCGALVTLGVAACDSSDNPMSPSDNAAEVRIRAAAAVSLAYHWQDWRHHGATNGGFCVVGTTTERGDGSRLINVRVVTRVARLDGCAGARIVRLDQARSAQLCFTDARISTRGRWSAWRGSSSCTRTD